MPTYYCVNITYSAFEAEDDDDAEMTAPDFAGEEARLGHGVTVFPANASLPDSVARLLSAAEDEVDRAEQELRSRYPAAPPVGKAVARRRALEQEHRRFSKSLQEDHPSLP